MIKRVLAEQITSRLFKGKAIIILGPRQVGKTTLIKEVLRGREYLSLNGDEATVRTLFEQPDLFKMKQIVDTNDLLFVDEAQRIPDIGLALKIIIDQIEGVQLLVSGSSALEINNRMQEPLTGRKWEYHMFPISWEEFEMTYGMPEGERQLEHRLIYGMYPAVVAHPADERDILQELAGSYLYKDILSIAGIRKPELLERLLKALALQLGSEVSFNELSNLLQVDKETVMRYIDILEKAFIIFQLNSFSRNQRNEIKNNRKIYFYDNGVRNMIINNLNPINLRTDKGALWENFLISERIKYQAYHKLYTSNYFWRTTQRQEIDFIEERDGMVTAYEFKWKADAKTKFPQTFIKTYNANGYIIDRSNFRKFVKPES